MQLWQRADSVSLVHAANGLALRTGPASNLAHHGTPVRSYTFCFAELPMVLTFRNSAARLPVLGAGADCAEPSGTACVCAARLRLQRRAAGTYVKMQSGNMISPLRYRSERTADVRLAQAKFGVANGQCLLLTSDHFSERRRWHVPALAVCEASGYSHRLRYAAGVERLHGGVEPKVGQLGVPLLLGACK